MTRKVLFAWLLAFLPIPIIHAQLPTDGQVEGSSYVNSYFHFSYSWPAFLQPFDTNALSFARKSPYNDEFLIFSARQGEQQYGIVVLAQKLNVPATHTQGFKDEEDLMSWIIRGFRPEQHVAGLSRRAFRNSQGTTFDELTYVEFGMPSSAIVTQFGQFLIVFKCNAKSVADLTAMDQSIEALRKLR